MDKNKQILSEMINRAVREAVNERLSRENTIDMLVESVVDDQLGLLLEKHTPKAERKAKKAYDTNMRSKRKIVLQWLRNPAVNMAEIRRQLEGEPESQSDEDTGRSLFVKKVNQTHGKRFNDEEINALYALKSTLGQ
jgi:hypothetical protein